MDNGLRASMLYMYTPEPRDEPRTVKLLISTLGTNTHVTPSVSPETHLASCHTPVCGPSVAATDSAHGLLTLT